MLKQLRNQKIAQTIYEWFNSSYSSEILPSKAYLFLNNNTVWYLLAWNDGDNNKNENKYLYVK